jgi:hypothetical protein
MPESRTVEIQSSGSVLFSPRLDLSVNQQHRRRFFSLAQLDSLPYLDQLEDENLMKAENLLITLRSLGSRKGREGMERFGITSNHALGISTPARRFARVAKSRCASPASQEKKCSHKFPLKVTIL